MSPQQFTSYLTQLGEAFGFDFTTNQLLTIAWHEAMAQIPPQDLPLALMAAVSKFRFRPTPEEFLECYFSKKQLSIELMGWEEWKILLSAIKDPLKTFELSPQGELALDALGGFKVLGELATKDLISTGKEFVRLSRLYAEALKNGTIAPPPKKIVASKKAEEIISEPERISPEVWANFTERINALRNPKNNNLTFNFLEEE